MARYSDADKAKKKTRGSSSGYGAEQEPSAEYGARDGYGAEPEPTTRAVEIQVYADTPGDAGKQPLPGVVVTLASEEGTTHFEDIQTTLNDGKVSWPGLAPGLYTATAAPPEGFAVPDAETVDLTRQDQVIEIAVEPEPAIVRFRAYHDALRTCDPAGQEPLNHPVTIEVFKDGKKLGSYSTKQNGCADVPVKQFGMITVRAQQKLRIGKQSLQLPSSVPMMVKATPGSISEVHAGYQPQPAELEVTAFFVEPGQPDLPLAGVMVSLYSGPAPTGKPLRQKMAPYIFSDLTSDTYTLVATQPPVFRGDAIEPSDPVGGVTQVYLDSGLTPIEFRFQRSHGKLIGYVYTAETLEPLPQIELLLTPQAGGVPIHTWTGIDGAFTFPIVPAGNYDLTLQESKVTAPDGRRWVPAENRPLKVPVQIAAGKLTNLASPLLMNLDEHLLTVSIVKSDGKPAPGFQFEVFDEQNNLHGPYGVGDDGTTTLRMSKAGTYRVGLSTFDNGEPRLFPNVVAINPHGKTTLQIPDHKGGHPKWLAGSGSTEATIDIPYPLITESASMGGGSWGPSAPSSSTDLGQTVQEALRSVLNWRSAGFNGDAKGFVAALNQSFTLTQTQGHTEFTWTPRSYAAVQSGLGALTGAQASIYTRAKVALDQITPLLAGLYPLLSDADPQNVEAIRAIVRSGLTELVNEFGIEGGPRVLRVDSLFRQLLGSPVPTDPEELSADGQLKQLSKAFGLERSQVNTIDEEQNLTNFLIIVDYTLSLQQSWVTQRGSFTRGPNSKPFLGTQLVLVERSLAVVAESVQEVYMTLDSVFVGKEERQVVELSFPPYKFGEGASTLFVSELLGWIDQVASNEGPQLIKDGGKQGVISFKDTVSRLAFLASHALLSEQATQLTGPNLPKGYRTARVQNALSELAAHLNETSNLINPFQ